VNGLHLRKTSLERLLAQRPEGVFINPFERGEIGPDLFRAAWRMGRIWGYPGNCQFVNYEHCMATASARSLIAT
jgi:hypothetical protein